MIDKVKNKKKKRFLSIKKLGVLGLSIFFLFSEGVNTVKASSWLDDWYKDMLHSSSGLDYFKGQKRNYLTFGSFSARIPVRNDYVFSISPPRLRIGCGGIDAFWGGIAFLNTEYLVQKLQLLLQAAPFIAFKVALETLWPEGSQILDKAEHLINLLNQIQVSECGIYIPKGIVSATTDLLGSVQAQVEKIASIKTGADADPQSVMKDPQNMGTAETRLWHKLWSAFYKETNKGIYVGDTSRFFSGVSGTFQNYLNATKVNPNLGLFEYLASQTYDSKKRKLFNIFRAYIGDIQAVTDNAVFKFKYVKSCPEVHPKDIFQNGTIYIKDGTTCKAESSREFFDKVQGGVYKLYNAMRRQETINLNNENDDVTLLLKYSPLPLYTLVKYAALTNQEALVYQIADPVAKGLIYNGLIDLSRQFRYIIETARHEIGKPPPPSENGTSTNGQELVHFTENEINNLKKELNEFEAAIYKLYANVQQEIANSLSFAISYMKFQELVLRNLKVNPGLINVYAPRAK